MMEFKGFPARMQFTPVPNLVFSALLPNITDVNELKVLLHIFEIIYPKKGNLRFLTYNELFNHAGIVNDLKDESGNILKESLESLTQKGVILYLPLRKADKTEELFYLNNEANRLTIARIQSGEIVLPDLKYEAAVQPIIIETSDIFTLYEQNIGMLTPLIADELKEAGKQYPEDWIKEAIKIGVSSNKRNWRYIARILEHWSTEGKDDGAYRGNNKKNEDPDKYFRGKYGHIVRR
jgi:DNA replication protein